jgi:ribA/ribD-fused uncharacterized protein
MTMTEAIRFCSPRMEYGCFSNFSRHSIRAKGKSWPTSEHYYQAQKFAGTPYEEEIRKAKSPKAAAILGRDPERPLRGDWEAVKFDVMRQAVWSKFSQRKEIRDTLLGTGDAELVEHTARDPYWGDGGDGSGKNMMGKILMRVRGDLRARDANLTMHEAFLRVCKELPGDFQPWGDRDRDSEWGPDCSCGCRHFLHLEGDLGYDWGVCSNPASPRFGLLTFEHMGCDKFGAEDDDEPLRAFE